MKEKSRQKVIYYHDELNDEFSSAKMLPYDEAERKEQTQL